MADNEKVLNTRIKLKIATYAEWTDETQAGKGANFVLKRGEIGLCQIGSTDETGKAEATTNPTVLFKVGDGTTPFKTLKWASALAADVYGWAKKPEAEFTAWVKTLVPLTLEDTGSGKFITGISVNGQKITITRSDVAWADIVDKPELPDENDFGVLTVTKKDGTAIEVDNTDSQNPKIGFIIDPTSQNATGDTAVKLSQSNSGLKAEVNLSNFATKEYVSSNEKDTKTTVAAGDYITVELTTNSSQFTENSTNNYKVSVNEDALKTLIGKETTAAMEFKGTTSSLPTNPSNGDMWKVVDVNSSTKNDITINGVAAKAGDAIVANVVVNDDDTKSSTWYLIPSGDSDTDTWRVLQVESSSISNTDTVNFVGGDHITVTQSSSSNITDVTISLDHDYISGCTHDEDKAIGFDIYRAGVCEGESTQERLVGMLIEEGTDIEFETSETDSGKLVMAKINHATINTTSANNNATLAHSGTFDAITGVTTSSNGHVTEIKTTTFTLPEATDISGKMNLVPDAVAGHYAMFDENGQVVDGGHIAGFTDDDIFACPPDIGNGNIGSGFTFGIAEHIPCPSDNGTVLPGETPTGQNPVLRVSIAGDEDYINVTRVYNDANDHAQTGELALEDRYAEAIGQISLSDTAKASLAKANSALQEITTIDTSADHTHGTETNCGGLKVTQNKDNKGDVIPGSVNIEIDDAITFILDCGGAE